MEITRPKREGQENEKSKRGKKRIAKRDRSSPAFRDARARKAESRTNDTGDPSIP